MTIARLQTKLESNRGVIVLRVETIRDHCGYARLGIYVVQQMARKLDRAGIGFLPVESTEFPMNRNEKVALYLKSSRVGQVLEATRRPTLASSMQTFRAANTDDAADLIEEIRSLIGIGEEPE
jgi:hypothetical protein